jgi:hypothetical protein
MFANFARIVLVSGLALTGAMCSSDSSSPTAPTNDPAPDPTPPPATPNPPPATPARGNVEVRIQPNPVPFSGRPITDAASCAGSKNTWFYEQILRETGGSSVTITGRTDSFDGRRVNNVTNLNIVVPANGSMTIRSRWCSATSAAHTAQTTFTGRDAAGNSISTSGGAVRLLAK